MLVKTKSGGWRGFLFHSLDLVIFHSRKPRVEWEWVDKYTGIYQSARLNSQTITRAPAWVCSSKALSIQLVTMQVPSRRSHGMFRSQKTYSQVQISQQISKEF